MDLIFGKTYLYHIADCYIEVEYCGKHWDKHLFRIKEGQDLLISDDVLAYVIE